MVIAVCLSLAIFSLMIWIRRPEKKAHLIFAVTAVGAGLFATTDLLSFYTSSVEVLVECLRWANLGVYMILIGLVWFLYFDFRTARLWLAISVSAVWSFLIILNFIMPYSMVYGQISGVELVQLPWGENVFRLIGTRTFWSNLSDVVSIILLLYYADTSVRLWKKGDRKRAGIIGGSILLFITAAGIHTPLVDLGLVTSPYLVTFAYMFIIAAMGIEMSNDIIRSAQLFKRVQSQELRWRNLLENIQLLIVGLDESGNISYINPYFLSFSGYKEKEIRGKNWFKIFIPEGKQSHMKNLFNELVDWGLKPHYQNSILLKGGALRTINWSNVVLRDDQENVSGILSIGSDVTDQLASFEEIQKLKDRIEEENIYLREEIISEHNYREIIGNSDALKYALSRIEQASNTDTTVLLEGETGVGKELFARAIHETGVRKNRTLVKVNCAAIPPNLLESELFGHEKGAFTGAHKMRKGRFELADGGTLFLDEIGELPLEVQSKLLQVLEEGTFERLGGSRTLKVDVRIIAATNRRLRDEVEAGRFREDLYYRINVYPISIPPLRKRMEDIPLLIELFVNIFTRKTGKKISKIPKSTLDELLKYNWPGNVRELRNIIERAVLASSRDKLVLADKLTPSADSSKGMDFDKIISMEEMERQYITSVLEQCQWRISGAKGAAALLEMHPNTLRNRMIKLGINKSAGNTDTSYEPQI